MSLDKVVLNLNYKEYLLGLCYIATSRITTLGSIIFEEAFDLSRLQLIRGGKTAKIRAADAKRRKPQHLPLPTSSIVIELQHPTLGLAFYYTSNRNRLRQEAVDNLSSNFRALISNYLEQDNTYNQQHLRQDDTQGQQEQLEIGIDESGGFNTSEGNSSLLGFKDKNGDRDKDNDKNTIIRQKIRDSVQSKYSIRRTS